VVAALAASPAATPPSATITVTRRLTRSAASSGSRPPSPWPERYARTPPMTRLELIRETLKDLCPKTSFSVQQQDERYVVEWSGGASKEEVEFVLEFVFDDLPYDLIRGAD